MIATAPQPGQLSLEALRLRQYLRWATLPNFAASAALLGTYLVSHARLTLIMAVLVSLNAVLMEVARRVAGRDRVDAAILWQASGMWLVALALVIHGIPFYPPGVMCAVLPVVVAVPYVSLAALVRMSAIATGVVAVGAALVISGASLQEPAVPDMVHRVFFFVGLPVLAAVPGLSLWHTRLTLKDATERMETANQALRQSERSLEQKVLERTVELETSERDLAAARDEALAANRHKSAFLANMSHELRTPLNAIIGFSEVLGERLFGELNEKQSEYAQDIHGSGKHLLSVINDILDLSKVEAGRLNLALASFPLPLTIENAITAVEERAGRRGVTLTQEIEPTVGEITADERKLKQALLNLLANAVKFTPEGGTVTLRARVRGDAVEIAVTDSGIGIAPEDQGVIFEAFRQAGTDHSRASEGTGLGLALTKRLVELHGGTITVESTVGRGSTFTVILPLTRRDQLAAGDGA